MKASNFKAFKDSFIFLIHYIFVAICKGLQISLNRFLDFCLVSTFRYTLCSYLLVCIQGEALGLKF